MASFGVVDDVADAISCASTSASTHTAQSSRRRKTRISLIFTLQEGRKSEVLSWPVCSEQKSC